MFAVADTISLDTSGLQGLPFDWRHYGGPLALFRLSQFVRINILGHKPRERQVVPIPQVKYYRQGDLILTWLDRDDVPDLADATVVTAEGLELPDGHRLVPNRKTNRE